MAPLRSLVPLCCSSLFAVELQKAAEELRKTNKELETNCSHLRRLELLMLPMFIFCRAASGGKVGRLKRVEAEKMSEGSRQQVHGESLTIRRFEVFFFFLFSTYFKIP